MSNHPNTNLAVIRKPLPDDATPAQRKAELLHRMHRDQRTAWLANQMVDKVWPHYLVRKFRERLANERCGEVVIAT